MRRAISLAAISSTTITNPQMSPSTPLVAFAPLLSPPRSNGEHSEGSDSFPTRSESSENGEKDGERRSVRVCMVRKDLTTVWCEAVFSLEANQGGEGNDETSSSEKVRTGRKSEASERGRDVVPMMEIYPISLPL